MGGDIRCVGVTLGVRVTLGVGVMLVVSGDVRCGWRC